MTKSWVVVDLGSFWKKMLEDSKKKPKKNWTNYNTRKSNNCSSIAGLNFV